MQTLRTRFPELTRRAARHHSELQHSALAVGTPIACHWDMRIRDRNILVTDDR